ncbi:MAG: cupin [Omnitrophica bacterium RIFCSPLOWO2_12_FULL_44_17]|uniref:Cupin n=1 Tax=Candidatus Danuiimicrobium aquiferis TaxID=1801832 RepID=A0A1G1L176_9BACT|nr:MAG: cupin [Omnitrophica bacterium RIFCSPHIGHO2_02_FULL_45_28]OGW90484.1 MAG: cupin [Omnitrophica bacterium RIFCSPHIGHO2_12_FULL_44_12]OGW98891.1 MAG: cupin [Omnitrophica bacterium RIFCSPLOWO2_12_FULL_44_17]OGX02016.1 MAG: cupin [Omnitrophica bacterium RIFCSPLOWO2_02_FULL_44_11]
MPKLQIDSRIKVEKPSKEKLDQLKIANWPIWTKEASTFDWFYDDREICYFLEGKGTVKTDQGEASFQKGDLVTFPKGLSCTWHITEPVRKHYFFG